jgi:DNA-binding MarR family transcriptional regulator
MSAEGKMAIRSKCACTRVRRAARVLTTLYDEALAPAGVGLNIAQFALLRAVGRMDAPSLSELAAEMALDRSTLGRNVSVLQRMHLLDVSDGDDLRARRITLTARAQRTVERCLPRWEEAQHKVEARLGSNGMATLLDLLERLETVE